MAVRNIARGALTTAQLRAGVDHLSGPDDTWRCEEITGSPGLVWVVGADGERQPWHESPLYGAVIVIAELVHTVTFYSGSDEYILGPESRYGVWLDDEHFHAIHRSSIERWGR